MRGFLLLLFSLFLSLLFLLLLFFPDVEKIIACLHSVSYRILPLLKKIITLESIFILECEFLVGMWVLLVLLIARIHSHELPGFGEFYYKGVFSSIYLLSHPQIRLPILQPIITFSVYIQLIVAFQFIKMNTSELLYIVLECLLEKEKKQYQFPSLSCWVLSFLFHQ